MKETTVFYLKRLLCHKMYLWVILFTFIPCSTILAQNITVKGTVKDSYGMTFPGVFIAEKGTNTSTSTNADGSYQISVAPNSTLVFSFIGMQTQEVAVNNRAIIDVVLQDDAIMLDEVVAVAYGTQRKEHLSGAISVVDVRKTLESRPVADVGRALQGSTPGLIVTTTSGDLGVTPKIKIRGNTSTLSGNDGDPLILVDNVEVPDMNFVNPDDIESISILKDASTTVIYGPRAAFGAILITTKKGTDKEKVTVNYSNNFSWNKLTEIPEHTRADIGQQYSLDQMNGLRASPLDGFSPFAGYYISTGSIAKTKQWIETYGDGSGLGREMIEGRDFNYNGSLGASFYRPWDVRSLFYKDWATQQQHNISVNGGTKTTRYTLGAGFANQNGLLKEFDDFYRRYNLSGNISTDINKYVTLRSGYLYTRTSQEKPMSFYAGVNDLQEEVYGPTYYVYRWHNIYPYGTYDGKEFRSGLTEMRAANALSDDYYYSRYNVGLTVNIMKGLRADFDYTYNQTMYAQHRAGGKLTAIDIFNPIPPDENGVRDFNNAYRQYTDANANYAAYDASRNLRNAYNGALVYETSLKNHSFKAQAGTNIEDAQYVYQRSKAVGLLDPSRPEPNLTNGTQSIKSSHSWWSVVGLYGRLNYNYSEKYLLEASIRYDWSSKFAKNDRSGAFPSVSAAWRITEEPWMEAVKPIMNNLKLRASYGEIGNQDVPNAAFKPTLEMTGTPNEANRWIIGNAFVPYVGSAAALVDPTLSWETVSTLDFGFDANFLKNKLTLSAGWYERRVKDMITTGEALPNSVGATAARRNFGELTTKGIEIELHFNHTFANGLRVNASAMFTDYKSRITKWADADDPLLSINSTTAQSANFTGKVVGDIWGYRTEGLWQKDDFVYNADGTITTTTVDGKVTNVMRSYAAGYQQLYESGSFRFSPGDVKFSDLDGSGVVDYGRLTVNDHGDLTVIGNTEPRYLYSFRLGAAWYGFDFDVFFQGVGKRDAWVTGNMVLPGWFGSEANFSHTLDYWTEDNPGAFYPRPINYANTKQWNYQTNDRYLLNMAYLRCKSVNIGYTIPNHITKKLYIERLRVYLNGENLFEFDKLGDIPIDPELDNTTLTSNDARSFGRAYPYRRSFSFGIQVTF